METLPAKPPRRPDLRQASWEWGMMGTLWLR